MLFSCSLFRWMLNCRLKFPKVILKSKQSFDRRDCSLNAISAIIDHSHIYILHEPQFTSPPIIRLQVHRCRCVSYVVIASWHVGGSESTVCFLFVEARPGNDAGGGWEAVSELACCTVLPNLCHWVHPGAPDQPLIMVTCSWWPATD